MSDSERPDADRMAYTITPGREPATDFDTSEVQRRLRRMPFAGEIMAPHVRAVEQDPLPPINEKGFRECEGWVAVYEAVVQESWINGMGGLHGGAAAWLVDMITGASFARLRVPPGKGQGPSISIDMNYYNAAPA
ncbi:hypothetical protein A1Q2_00566 [Trichosporon asahii var. asahii CBS 8904]|uniref:Thioesterase domain-containing protein n=2 Tax=Trichosporon asahii var. asahii TaxID=189963 RepID=K1VM07_TRIAC|nr:hypothetical protein A1Q1_03972 [Trichosporon asahii var. asahii CBS 2479]EJT52456.1 hypothetical protein A1Q1_03972 [Trichosporon asahii var. asahii CBS 2479]EKD05145.1 hypothetical protein A1Q2_00566 [Trichosporon asahii var. asahii CBS 8904]